MLNNLWDPVTMVAILRKQIAPSAKFIKVHDCSLMYSLEVAIYLKKYSNRSDYVAIQSDAATFAASKILRGYEVSLKQSWYNHRLYTSLMSVIEIILSLAFLLTGSEFWIRQLPIQ